MRYEQRDRVAVITIARPEVRNAMNLDVFDGLWEAGRRAGADPDVRAVVVTGEGAAFSSGIDVSLFAGDAGVFDPITVDVRRFQRAFTVFEEIAHPTIAAVHGAAFGAGAQLAIACDLRVVAADAEISIMETKWGIIPDLGGTQRLPRLVGLGRAKEMAFTMRRVRADEAETWGLANRIVPAGEDVKNALEWARELASGPPIALAGIKRLMNGAFDRPVRTGLEHEAMTQRRAMASADFVEAVTARFEKREPRYTGR